MKKTSSVAACLKIVLPNVWNLWILSWIDGWITVNQILERLPKKEDRRTPLDKLLSEMRYYAWKIGTIGILPSLITGRGMIESLKHSISLVEHKLKEVAVLRAGYSVLCWIVGIFAYIGSILFFSFFENLIPSGSGISKEISEFYFWVAVPILIAIAVILLLLRPAYIISSCDIYSEFLIEEKQKIMLPLPPPRAISALIGFSILILIIAIVFFYRYELGIMALLSIPY